MTVRNTHQATNMKWHPIYGGRYAVSSTGIVVRVGIHRGNTPIDKLRKALRPRENRGGYLQHTLAIAQGRLKTVTVHRLVAVAFVSRPRGCNQVNHKDGNKKNNRDTNLEWVNAAANTRHAIATGLRDFSGECNPQAVLRRRTVERILRMFYVNGLNQQTISDRTGVKVCTISAITSRRNWSDVPIPTQGRK